MSGEKSMAKIQTWEAKAKGHFVFWNWCNFLIEVLLHGFLIPESKPELYIIKIS